MTIIIIRRNDYLTVGCYLVVTAGCNPASLLQRGLVRFQSDGLPMLGWRNWYTHTTKDRDPEGSSPSSSTAAISGSVCTTESMAAD